MLKAPRNLNVTTHGTVYYAGLILTYFWLQNMLFIVEKWQYYWQWTRHLKWESWERTVTGTIETNNGTLSFTIIVFVTLCCWWYRAYSVRGGERPLTWGGVGGGAHIHIFEFCIINSFWNHLLLRCVNMDVRKSPPLQLTIFCSPCILSRCLIC